LTPSLTSLAAIQMAKAAENAVYAFQLTQEGIPELEVLIEVRKRKSSNGRKYVRNGKLLSASDVSREQVYEMTKRTITLFSFAP
jgi:hypothetical protein